MPERSLTAACGAPGGRGPSNTEIVAPSAWHSLARRPAQTGFATLCALGVLLTLSACGEPAPASESKADVPPALTVTTIAAGHQTIDRNIVGTGSVVAWQELSIGTEIGGWRVVEVPVEEGDTVTRGQLLARIDDMAADAQFRHAEAAVREAEANLRFAQSENERAKDLIGKGTVSPQTAQDRQTKAYAADARLGMARALRDEMKTRLVATRILAPADGYISKRSILIGDVVAAGREAFRMVRDSRLKLDAQVPENDVSLVQVGQTVRVFREGSAPITASVRAVAPTVDPKTRLATVHVALPTGSPLKPGMFARAEIMTSSAAAIAVPETSLVWRDAKAHVFVLQDRKHVALRQVEPGNRQGGFVTILGGLEPGDQVVSTGAGFLNDGDSVTVQDMAAESATRRP